jgi:transcriptional regulator with XRE-family HTH domain
MKFNQALGKAIQWRRHDLNIPQHQICEQLKMSRAYLSGIENGVSNPGVNNIYKIAVYLQTKVSDLCLQAQVFLKEKK